MSDSRTNRTRKQARHLKEQLRTLPPIVSHYPNDDEITWPDEWLTPEDKKGNR